MSKNRRLGTEKTEREAMDRRHQELKWIEERDRRKLRISDAYNRNICPEWKHYTRRSANPSRVSVPSKPTRIWWPNVLVDEVAFLFGCLPPI